MEDVVQFRSMYYKDSPNSTIKNEQVKESGRHGNGGKKADSIPALTSVNSLHSSFRTSPSQKADAPLYASNSYSEVNESEEKDVNRGEEVEGGKSVVKEREGQEATVESNAVSDNAEEEGEGEEQEDTFDFQNDDGEKELQQLRADTLKMGRKVDRTSDAYKKRKLSGRFKSDELFQ
jgi:hypothetical protein